MAPSDSRPAGGDIAISSSGLFRLLRCELDPWHHRLGRTLIPEKAGVLRHSPGISGIKRRDVAGIAAIGQSFCLIVAFFGGTEASRPNYLFACAKSVSRRQGGWTAMIWSSLPPRLPLIGLRGRAGRHWGGFEMPLLHVMRDFGRWLRWITLIIAATAVLQAAANALPVF
jgi:hypothetical protein